MTEKPLVIIGSGGHACVVAEAAHLSGWQIAGHIAPTKGAPDDLLGNWLGTDDALDGLLAQGLTCILGLGFVDAASAKRRAAMLDALEPESLATVVHTTASIAPSAKLGAGSFVAAQSVVGTRAVLGIGALVNTGAIIEHHNGLGRNCHIATGARLTGNVTVGDNVLIGAASVIRQGLNIEDNAIVGAGCVVLSDVPAQAIWGGNPGRALL